MAVLTLTQQNQLNNALPVAKQLGLAGRLRDGESLQHIGRLASSHVRIATNPTNGDTLTLTAGPTTVDGIFHAGSTVIYEFQSSAAAAAGHVLVVTGANAAASATALAAVINATLGVAVTAAAHATDTTVVDVIRDFPGGTLTLTPSSATRTPCQNNAEALAKGDYALYSLTRAITAEDVTRTRIRVNTGLTSIDTVVARIAVSATDNTPFAYNGTVSMSGGVIELTLGTSAGVFAAAQILSIMAVGVR
jgi:hypothetical protein